MKEGALTRREFLKLVGASSATLALGKELDAALNEKGRRPNILIILADDLGYAELGCQGNKDIPTPNIDSIASQGVRFTNGYVSCPVCSPTRAGLMTGRYQERFGHEFNPGPPTSVEKDFGLPLTETTIASRLKSEGYVTGLVGKWHLGYEEKYLPLNRGFDEFFGFPGGAHSYIDSSADAKNPIMRGMKPIEEKEYLTDAFSREAAAFIERHKNKSFFLYLAFNAVHSPLQAPEKYLKRFSSISDNKRRTFAAMLSAMDDAVGNVLQTLRKNNLEENTLIFFLSDNGVPTQSTTSRNDPLRGFKAQVYEGGIRVPFLMQWKGKIPAGMVCDKPVIALDIAPTALAAAGARIEDAKFDGVNLMPHLRGSSTPHEMLYWRFGPQYAIRKGNWKLLKTAKGKPELYDLAADISEMNDLAEKNPEKVKALQAHYEAWNAQLAKPLWGSTLKEKLRSKNKNANSAS
jgi:arylsulfatase A-like enzyme